LQQLIETNDIAVLPSGKSAGLTFYYITKSIIEDDGNVRVYNQAKSILLKLNM
jgi:phenylacetate-CoA ligase